MRGINYRILALIFPLSLRLALPSDYKTWYGSAKNSFSRGKSTYDELVKSAQNSEDECVILHSTDNRLSTTQGAGRGTGTESGSFPCLDHLQHKDNRSNFDINFNIGDVAGGSREQRLVAEGGCWQFVLNQVSALDIDRCDVKGEVSRSLIALAKTKCHLIRSGRTFPLAEHGCLLNPDVLDDNALGLLGDQYTSNPCRSVYNSGECEKLKEDIVAQCTNPRVMTEAAFQMYHADLNHIDDICFYLQSNEWNRRTESNINRLGESAINLLNTQQNMEMFLAGMQKQQEESLRKATR
ncbi:membrane protein, putative [Babesia bigemina]|uniref:Membrane protein, putative n=1 Tax=Babesia bigemina TaxID=5866 RepID=A0A061D9M0_BABBI|nr:membrane protein, putative [Babesia bigemina]CDR95619.1 membrane protein, putative [Babesia bigemina]|eukprot:XP_012767805.1 membrane protein, putative [Babesia bigemina]